MRPRPTVVEAVLARWVPVASLIDSGDVALSSAAAPHDGLCGSRDPRRSRLARWTTLCGRTRPATACQLHLGHVMAGPSLPGAVPARRLATHGARRWAAAHAEVADRRDARCASSSGLAASIQRHPGAPRRAVGAPMTAQHVLCGQIHGANGHPSALLATVGGLMTTGRNTCMGSVATGTVPPDAPDAARLHLHAQWRPSSWTDGAMA